jgi:hypothetical protein
MRWARTGCDRWASAHAALARARALRAALFARDLALVRDVMGTV